MAVVNPVGKWLVAGQAVYRVLFAGPDEWELRIEAGSDRVKDREVTMPLGQIRFAVGQGEMRLVARRPEHLIGLRQGSKVDQEAELTQAKGAEASRRKAVDKGKVRDGPGPLDGAATDPGAGDDPGAAG